MTTEGSAKVGRRRAAAREYTFDVLFSGEPMRRRLPVLCRDGAVLIDGEPLDLPSAFWVSRRAGMVLVCTRRETVAFFGASADLEEIARTVERESVGKNKRSLFRPLASEVIVCAAGTAARGEVGEDRIDGLFLAVFTYRGLHLFAGEVEHTVRWPVLEAEEVAGEVAGEDSGQADRPKLHLASNGVSLTLGYLFPEEMRAVARISRTVPPPMPVEGSAVEMFPKGQVTPPLPVTLPKFSVASDTLQRACISAAARVRIDPSVGEHIDKRYFELHFQALGEIALGPLMLRRSAALEAKSRSLAVEAMDAAHLRSDAVAAFHEAAEELIRVYSSEVEQLASEKRLSRDHMEQALDVAVRASPGDATGRQIEALGPTFDAVLAKQQLLLQQLKVRDMASPESDEAGVNEATRAWTEEVEKLDAAYGAAWGEVLAEIAEIWSRRFIPALRGLAALRGRRLSEGIRYTILLIVIFFAVAAVAWILFGPSLF